MPVYRYLAAVRDAIAVEVLQVESRRADAMNELRGDVAKFASALRINGTPRNTRITGTLLNAGRTATERLLVHV